MLGITFQGWASPSGQPTSTRCKAQTPTSTYNDQTTSSQGGGTLVQIRPGPSSSRLQKVCRTNPLHLRWATKQSSDGTPRQHNLDNCQGMRRTHIANVPFDLQGWALPSKGGQRPPSYFPPRATTDVARSEERRL